MADARREHEFDVAIATGANASAFFVGKFNAATANPVRNARTERLSREVNRDGKEGFKLLEAGLRLIANKVAI